MLYNVSRQLAQHMAATGITRMELARKLNVEPTNVSSYLTGRVSVGQIPITKLAAAFDKTVEQFLGFVPDFTRSTANYSRCREEAECGVECILAMLGDSYLSGNDDRRVVHLPRVRYAKRRRGGDKGFLSDGADTGYHGV